MIAKDKFILSLAPNGMVPTKEMTAHVPVTPLEVAEDIKKCIQAGGITYLHLHARDERGTPTGDKKIYEQFIAAVKETAPDLTVCISCSGRMDPSFEGRSKVLDISGDLKPDMASLTLSSLNFSKTRQYQYTRHHYTSGGKNAGKRNQT
jgi:3-keto-5-aminohexanoate cleavage enzyme